MHSSFTLTSKPSKPSIPFHALLFSHLQLTARNERRWRHDSKVDESCQVEYWLPCVELWSRSGGGLMMLGLRRQIHWYKVSLKTVRSSTGGSLVAHVAIHHMYDSRCSH